ncbi:hydroxyethylthiazole kinase [Oceanobacillus manasiensis]|uniref:hydroxyethylthiazole kinase n=1 Tax=Oceanobacillus manasiensis TaxID=586413 RepID=UPI0005A914E9|nr:hydroxyethylthiazole kinase [Oceanobacillus manasiensis]
MNAQIIKEVRETNPLIHHLTNQVVMNFTANGLLSFGGSPVMAKAEEEATEMASVADGVLINIGTLTSLELPAMVEAGIAANKKGIPVVLDPVGVAATTFRSNAVRQLTENIQFTAIKGNAGEMAHLVHTPWETKGVDSVGDGDITEIAQMVADTYQTSVIVTGKTDYIYTDGNLYTNDSGHPLLGKITGAGCLLGSIITACLSTNYSMKDQLITAVSFYGHAADFAAQQRTVVGPGSFLTGFIDALSMDVEKVAERRM